MSATKSLELRRLREFTAALNDGEYDAIVLAFEKLCAEIDPLWRGDQILGLLSRSYESVKNRGTYGACINRDGDWWRD
jgi:hypothetical protein